MTDKYIYTDKQRDSCIHGYSMFRYNYTYRHTEKHSERHIEITADGQVTLCTNTYYKGWSYIHRPTDKLAEGQCVLFHTQSDLQSKKNLAYMEWQKYKQIYKNIKTEDLTQREEKKVITAGLTNTEGYND